MATLKYYLVGEEAGLTHDFDMSRSDLEIRFSDSVKNGTLLMADDRDPITGEPQTFMLNTANVTLAFVTD